MIPSISTKMPEAGLTTPSNLAELSAIIHYNSGSLCKEQVVSKNRLFSHKNIETINLHTALCSFSINGTKMTSSLNPY